MLPTVGKPSGGSPGSGALIFRCDGVRAACIVGSVVSTRPLSAKPYRACESIRKAGPPPASIPLARVVERAPLRCSTRGGRCPRRRQKVGGTCRDAKAAASRLTFAASLGVNGFLRTRAEAEL